MENIEGLENISVPTMGIVEDSVVDGDGLRLVLFVQGCPHHCKGCHNPQSWEIKRDRMTSLDKLFRLVQDNPLCSGITLSGGDPFLYAKKLLPLAEAIHGIGKTVWAFSGWTYEELMGMEYPRKLLEKVDVLVDGPFELEKRDLSLKFRGSWNQRVIDVAKTRMTKAVVLVYPDARLCKKGPAY